MAPFSAYDHSTPLCGLQRSMVCARPRHMVAELPKKDSGQAHPPMGSGGMDF